MREFCWILLLSSLLLAVSGRNRNERELEFMEHRVGLMEDGLRTFVYEAKPSITYLQNEVGILQSENEMLREKMSSQDKDIENLKWMASENKKSSLTQEERDLVTELKWTIFDLKMANEILQDENCKQNTVCKDWSVWSRCSATCGPGTAIRYRKCETSGHFASMCKPEDVQEEPCDLGSCITTTLLPQYDCPENYTSFKGNCFRFSGRQDARLLSTIICEEEDAHLVEINNDDKQIIVRDYLNIVAPRYMVDMHEDFSKREYWDYRDIDQKINVAIDGVRKHQRTYFLNWQDREMTYFNWAMYQPPDYKSDGDYCVTINVLTGKWNMLCCSVTFYYVCETEARLSV